MEFSKLFDPLSFAQWCYWLRKNIYWATISVFFGIAFKEPPQSPRFSLTRFGMIRIFLQRRSSPCSSCSVKVANSLKYLGSAEYRCLYRAILKMLGLHTNNVIWSFNREILHRMKVFGSFADIKSVPRLSEQNYNIFRQMRGIKRVYEWMNKLIDWSRVRSPVNTIFRLLFLR